MEKLILFFISFLSFKAYALDIAGNAIYPKEVINTIGTFIKILYLVEKYP